MTEKSPFRPPVRRKIADIEEVQKPVSSNNFKNVRLVGMTFNMDPEWHRRFKMRALQENISMHELLIRSFDAFEEVSKIK